MTEEILPSLPNKKIYGPTGLFIAVLLGGPLAAAWVVNSNRNAVGKSNKKILVWVLAILCLVILWWIATVYPINVHFPWYYFFLNLLMTCWVLLKFSSKEYVAHRLNGGQLFSAWKGLAIGIIFLVLSFIIIMLGILGYETFKYIGKKGHLPLF